MQRANVGSMSSSLDDFLLPLGGTETSAVTCSSRYLCTQGVGHVHREKKVVLGSEDCMDRVDVVRAFAGCVQPVLGELQRRIRHCAILNSIKKISQFNYLWNKVVLRRAYDEVGCHLNFFSCCRSDSVGSPERCGER